MVPHKTGHHEWSSEIVRRMLHFDRTLTSSGVKNGAVADQGLLPVQVRQDHAQRKNDRTPSYPFQVNALGISVDRLLPSLPMNRDRVRGG